MQHRAYSYALTPVRLYASRELTRGWTNGTTAIFLFALERQLLLVFSLCVSLSWRHGYNNYSEQTQLGTEQRTLALMAAVSNQPGILEPTQTHSHLGIFQFAWDKLQWEAIGHVLRGWNWNPRRDSGTLSKENRDMYSVSSDFIKYV